MQPNFLSKFVSDWKQSLLADNLVLMQHSS